MQLSIFSSAERRASPSAPQGFAKDWLIRAATSRSSILRLLIELAPVGSSGKMSPVSCHRLADGTLVPSSGRWQNSGMGGPTEFLTLSSTEWPSAAVVCLLSDTLEADGPHLQPYFLSAKACAGILRRAERKGKDLLPRLERALRAQADSAQTTSM